MKEIQKGHRLSFANEAINLKAALEYLNQHFEYGRLDLHIFLNDIMTALFCFFKENSLLDNNR